MTTIFTQNKKHRQYDLLIVLIGWYQNRPNNWVLIATNPRHSEDLKTGELCNHSKFLMSTRWIMNAFLLKTFYSQEKIMAWMLQPTCMVYTTDVSWSYIFWWLVFIVFIIHQGERRHWITLLLNETKYFFMVYKIQVHHMKCTLPEVSVFQLWQISEMLLIPWQPLCRV